MSVSPRLSERPTNHRSLLFLAGMLVTFSFTALFANAAFSQSARVTSGEHEDFSRIVVGFDRATTWTVRRVTEGYRVFFEPRAPALDLRRVFDLIPRDRISDLEQSDEDGSLLVKSNCPCHLETFEAARWTLAIDVKDGAAPTDQWASASNPERPVNYSGGLREKGREDENTAAASNQKGRDAEIGHHLPTYDLARSLAAAPPFRSLEISVPLLARTGSFYDAVARPLEAPDASAGPNSIRSPTDALSAEDPSPTNLASDRQASMLDRLRRAAAAGWVDLRTDGGGPWHHGAQEDLGNFDLDRTTSRLDRLSDNMDFRSLFDLLDAPSEAAPSDHTQCIPDHELAFFRAESLDGDGMRELTRLRSSLVDDRGEIVPAAARSLIQHYLALGFGAEAASLAPMASLSPERSGMFLSLARIVDEGSDSAPEVWSGQQTCDSAAALWAILGQRDGIRGPHVNVMAVQRAFFDLDLRLRTHIGTELAERLDALGHDEAAHAIRSNIDPLLDAGPDLFPEVAPGAAERVVADLLDRVEDSIRSGRGVSQEDLDLAESLAWEYEGTEEGLKLRGMSALGRLQRNDVESAMSLLEAQWTGADRVWTETLEDGFALVVMAKSDADILRFAMHPKSSAVLTLLSPDQSLELARRLVDMGFPNRALDVLDTSSIATDIPETPERRLLLARAILETGDFMRSLALVAGLEDPAASEIRARAHTRLGNHALAADAYAMAEDRDEAARAAWISGDPEVIARHGTETQKALAEALDLSSPASATRPADAPSGGAGARRSTGGASTAADPADGEPGSEVLGFSADPTPGTDSTPGDRPLPDLLLPLSNDVPSLAEARALIQRSAEIRTSLGTLLPDE